jgi:hypothetical protein
MQVTHHLRIYPRDSDHPDIECLCNYDNGMSIISIITNSRPDIRFFITFNDLFENVNLFDGNENVSGLMKDKSCYYSPSNPIPKTSRKS